MLFPLRTAIHLRSSPFPSSSSLPGSACSIAHSCLSKKALNPISEGEVKYRTAIIMSSDAGWDTHQHSNAWVCELKVEVPAVQRAGQGGQSKGWEVCEPTIACCRVTCTRATYCLIMQSVTEAYQINLFTEGMSFISKKLLSIQCNRHSRFQVYGRTRVLFRGSRIKRPWSI